MTREATAVEKQEATVSDSKPLFMRLTPDLKSRIVHQCARLMITQTALVKQAIVKFLEEEEQIEADKAYRRR